MGLDQYIYSTESKFLKPVDFLSNLSTPPSNREEIAYWRNNRGVQKWMRDLYLIKGGDDPEFNGNPVQINREDIVRFVQGSSLVYTDIIPRRDLQWVGEALSCIAEGKTVYYNSSW